MSDAGRCGRTPPAPSPHRRGRLGAPHARRRLSLPKGRGELRDQPRRTRTRPTTEQGTP
ncbi:hypothetical protein GJU35_23990 [Streptomyces lincolnensis]|nr:hypothetical protein GJU35_23990 [Streptomyces lincolnensis]